VRLEENGGDSGRKRQLRTSRTWRPGNWSRLLSRIVVLRLLEANQPADFPPEC